MRLVGFCDCANCVFVQSCLMLCDVKNKRKTTSTRWENYFFEIQIINHRI